MKVTATAYRRLTDMVIDIINDEADKAGYGSVTVQMTGDDESFEVMLPDGVFAPAVLLAIKDRVVALYQQEGYVIEFDVGA